MEFIKKNKFGVLLPISALPGDYGIGDLGSSAIKFIDWLDEANATYWQVLPTTIAEAKTGCPYSSMSAFGGFPALISLENLCDMKLLEETELSLNKIPVNNVDYKSTLEIKNRFLKVAFENFCQLEENNTIKKDFVEFRSSQDDWCDDLASFLHLTETHGDKWWTWAPNFRDYQTYIKNDQKDDPQVVFHIFVQYIFYKQWAQLKKYANDKGILLIGDIPIFLSHHSMDVWRSPKLFKLNSDFTLRIQTGVPPDVFSKDGQTWNTPNYNWDLMKRNKFVWWKGRISYSLKAFDIVRFDHFIGLVNVFEIPPLDTHARNGSWVKTPGDELLAEVTRAFGNIPMIVEDLGEKTPQVDQLKDKYSLPGMKILMFAYSGDNKNEHLPSNYSGNEIVYTGTHDNNTLVGHFSNDASQEEKDNIKKKLGLKDFSNINWDIIEESFKSQAAIAIIPIQDFMGLDIKARFNLPGTTDNNWIWRFRFEDMKKNLADKIKNLSHKYGRQKK